jgi:hypothetical protein
VRVSRDKRGYEQISLLHAFPRRGKASKPRLLYVFRTPPGIKLGREPFDETIRREVEAQHPDIRFDWVKLSKIPAPPTDVEYWRERRRAEKAAKQAQREAEREDSLAEPEAEEQAPPPDPSLGPDPAGTDVGFSGEPVREVVALEAIEAIDDEIEPGREEDTLVDGEVAHEDTAGGPQPEGVSGEAPAVAARRRRRRRGGRRRHKRLAPPAAASAAEAQQPESPSGPDAALRTEPPAEPSKVSEDS